MSLTTIEKVFDLEKVLRGQHTCLRTPMVLIKWAHLFCLTKHPLHTNDLGKERRT